GYLENGRYVSSAAPGGIGIHSLAEDSARNIWIANQLGLFRLSPANEVQQISWDTFGGKDYAESLAGDPSQGGLWLGFSQGGIAYVRDGQVRASYSAEKGLGEGRVNDLRFDKQGALWASTEGGLSYLKEGRGALKEGRGALKDGQIATLSSKNGLPCDAV